MTEPTAAEAHEARIRAWSEFTLSEGAGTGEREAFDSGWDAALEFAATVRREAAYETARGIVESDEEQRQAIQDAYEQGRREALSWTTPPNDLAGPHSTELLRELLQALGEFDGARTETPAELWANALAKVRRNREALSLDGTEFACKKCHGRGEHVDRIGASDWERYICDPCGGTGLDLAAAPALAARVREQGRTIIELREAMRHRMDGGAHSPGACAVCDRGRALADEEAGT